MKKISSGMIFTMAIIMLLASCPMEPDSDLSKKDYKPFNAENPNQMITTRLTRCDIDCNQEMDDCINNCLAQVNGDPNNDFQLFTDCLNHCSSVVMHECQILKQSLPEIPAVSGAYC